MRPPYGPIPLVTIACVSYAVMEASESSRGVWVEVRNGSVCLRCWRAEPQRTANDIDSKSPLKRAYIVLPEVFGVNAWVRSVGQRLAAQGIPALAMPLFARSAPTLDLDYSDLALAEGRRHKDLTTAPQILSDCSAAITWLQRRCPTAEIDIAGFCFGGHAALLAATLPQVRACFDFYGAGVSTMRPGGGPPSLESLPQVTGRLTCICGTADPLIPADHRRAIQASLRAADPAAERFRYLELPGADHGFMCEARSSFSPKASALGWQLLLEG